MLMDIRESDGPVSKSVYFVRGGLCDLNSARSDEGVRGVPFGVCRSERAGAGRLR